MTIRDRGEGTVVEAVPLEIVPPVRRDASQVAIALAQFRDLAAVFALPFAGIGIVLLLHYGFGFSLATLVRDPLATANLSPLTGLLSTLGNLVWAATVAMCFFGTRVLRARRPRAEESTFFLLFGILSMVLLVDDQFRIHDYYESYIGIGEHTLFAIYMVGLVLLLLKFHRLILSAPWSLLAISLVCFAVSMIVDSGLVVIPHGSHLVEDGSKWMGICAWCAYFCRRLFATLSVPAVVPVSSAE